MEVREALESWIRSIPPRCFDEGSRVVGPDQPAHRSRVRDGPQFGGGTAGERSERLPALLGDRAARREARRIRLAISGVGPGTRGNQRFRVREPALALEHADPCLKLVEVGWRRGAILDSCVRACRARPLLTRFDLHRHPDINPIRHLGVQIHVDFGYPDAHHQGIAHGSVVLL